MGLFKNIFGSNAYSNRELKRIEPIKNKVWSWKRNTASSQTQS